MINPYFEIQRKEWEINSLLEKLYFAYKEIDKYNGMIPKDKHINDKYNIRKCINEWYANGRRL